MSATSASSVHPTLWSSRDTVRSSVLREGRRARASWSRVGVLRRELSDIEHHALVQALLQKAHSDEAAAEALVVNDERDAREREQLLALARLASALADVLEDVDAVCLLDRP